jgi:hypothetical protein
VKADNRKKVSPVASIRTANRVNVTIVNAEVDSPVYDRW